MQRVIISFCFLFSTTAFSQKAFDFIMTDTDGKRWHLYEELEKGKTVLLDFFYTDCVPCQSLTPKIANINSDYGLGSGELLVLGISDRDNNSKIIQFDTAYGVNYSSGGIEGNGDSITLAYQSWFSFIGWPTYAVICPNKNITWDIDKAQNGLPDIRNAIDTCILYTSTEEMPIEKNIKYDFTNDEINVLGLDFGYSVIEIYDSYGKLYERRKFNNEENMLLNLSGMPKGIYILNHIYNKGHTSTKFLKQ